MTRRAAGKINEDLFGSEHVVSDPALVMTMVNELLEAKRQEIIAEGWKDAHHRRARRLADFIDASSRRSNRRRPNRKNSTRGKNLSRRSEEADDYDKAARRGGGRCRAKRMTNWKTEIRARAVTPEIRGNAVCYVSVDHHGRADRTRLPVPAPALQRSGRRREGRGEKETAGRGCGQTKASVAPERHVERPLQPT